jgi:hypothetical protein
MGVNLAQIFGQREQFWRSVDRVAAPLCVEPHAID